MPSGGDPDARFTAGRPEALAMYDPEHYRQSAERAMAVADEARSAEVRDSWLVIAGQFLALARHAERQAARDRMRGGNVIDLDQMRRWRRLGLHRVAFSSRDTGR
jgi:hypothetical protein